MTLDIELHDLYSKRGKYSPEEKIQAVMVYLVTGDGKAVTKHTGIPHQTFYDWKNKAEWYPTLVHELRKEYNEQLDAKLTGTLSRIMDEIDDRLTNGDTFVFKGEERKVPIHGKNLATMAKEFFNMRALLRGDPTARTEQVSSEKKLDAIAERLERLSSSVQEKNARVLPETL